jgi:hypothetical protein
MVGRIDPGTPPRESIIHHPMSKRLEVLLRDFEYREFEALARRRRISLSEWARQALRAARQRETLRSTASGIRAE